MRDVTSTTALAKANKNTKIRLVISSFEQFKKEVNEIEKYKDKFVTFKVKLDFEKVVVEKANITNKKLEQILEEGIENIKDEEVRKLLKESLK